MSASRRRFGRYPAVARFAGPVLAVLLTALAPLSTISPAAASPAAAQPDPARLEIVAPALTYLGYSPAGPIAGEVRITNTATVPARHVVVRLELGRSRGVAVNLIGEEGDCALADREATCSIGDLLPGSAATLAVRWTMLTRHYNEMGSAVVTATADNAVTARRETAALAGTPGGFPDDQASPDVIVRAAAPTTLELSPGVPTDLPITLHAVGQAAAEGVFVKLRPGPSADRLRLTGPRGSTCIPVDDVFVRALLCYLAQRIVAGASSSWGAGNPFRVTAAAGSARSRPYNIGIFISPANGTYRNVGRNDDGTWRIQPTVPLTVTVVGNANDTGDGEVAAHVSDAAMPTADGSAVGAGGAAGLPVTGAPAGRLAAGAVLALILGVVAVLVGRRRRPAAV